MKSFEQHPARGDEGAVRIVDMKVELKLVASFIRRSYQLRWLYPKWNSIHHIIWLIRSSCQKWEAPFFRIAAPFSLNIWYFSLKIQCQPVFRIAALCSLDLAPWTINFFGGKIRWLVPDPEPAKNNGICGVKLLRKGISAYQLVVDSKKVASLARKTNILSLVNR